MTAPDARILVVGSINTDLVMQVEVAPEAGETVTGQSFATFGGGKGANQAVSAARSGASVAMLGGVGKDAFGAQRLRDLKTEGIVTETVHTFDDLPSGVAIILVEPDGENRIAYVPGATWGVTPDLARAALESWNPAVVLATLEHQHPVLQAVWTAAQQRGIPIICNATPEPSESAELALSASILIVNEVEAFELLGDRVDASWTAIAEALRTRGPDCVVITLGEDGAVVATEERTVAIPAPRVIAVDATGAGDAFCGAFAASIAEGKPAEEAASIGVVAGSISVTRPGAQPSMPTRAEIAAMMQVQ